MWRSEATHWGIKDHLINEQVNLKSVSSVRISRCQQQSDLLSAHYETTEYEHLCRHIWNLQKTTLETPYPTMLKRGILNSWIQIRSKTECVLAGPIPHPSTMFNGDPPNTCANSCLQRKKQTNQQGWKHKLLGGSKNGWPHPQPSQYSVFHHTHEFLMAQTVVSVHIKEFEDGVQHVYRQIMSRGDPHSSLKLGYSHKQREHVIHCKQCEKNTVPTRRVLTHSNRTAGSRDHFHWKGKVLQIVGEQAEGFELLKRDALQHKMWVTWH